MRARPFEQPGMQWVASGRHQRGLPGGPRAGRGWGSCRIFPGPSSNSTF